MQNSSEFLVPSDLGFEVESNSSHARTLETKLSKFFFLSLDGMVICEGEYFIYVNPAFVKMLGFSEAEILSKPALHFVHPDDRDYTTSFASQVASGETIHNLENRYMTKSGEYRNFSWTVVKDDSSNRVFCLARDVTEIKKKEQVIAKQKLHMAATSKLNALGRMAANVAHEINNPLTVIIGHATRIQLLSSRYPDQFNFENAALNIHNMCLRITRIISGLRSISREGSKDAFELTSLKKIIEETLALCKGKFQVHGIEINAHLPTFGVLIYCRSVQISQVLLNLLSNSFDAIVDTENAKITITAELLPEVVKIKIEDSGKIENDEIRSNLFTSFFTTKPIGKGTGLGLSICKTIISDHNGRIYLDESAPCTRFVIELPNVS